MSNKKKQGSNAVLENPTKEIKIPVSEQLTTLLAKYKLTTNDKLSENTNIN